MEENTMKKLLAAVLALALVLALVPAVMAEGEALEPVTLTVFIGDPGDAPAADNKIYAMIEEKFGVTFEFEYLAGNLDETLGLKIANKDYPDLFCGGNSADLIISGGALINLLDYVSPEKTPRLWAHIEPQKARLIDKDADGNDVLYIIPNYGLADGDQIVNAVNGPAFFVQKQVLAWAGYPQIKTLNEYFDLIANFIDANPTDANGNPYTGFAILCEDWRHFCLINPVQHLMGRPNDGEVYICVTDQNYEVTGNDPAVAFKTETFIDKPYAKAYYQKLNEAFQKGLIDPSTFTDSYDAYIAKLSSGTVLGMFDQTWDFGTATQALTDAKMYENTYVALGLVYDPEYVNGAAIEEHYVNGGLPNVRRGFGISVNCACPERIVAMWEEMLSDEWQILFNWGIEGEDYYIEDGRLLMTEEQYANLSNSTWKLENKADGIFTNSPKKQGYIMNDITIGDQVITAGNCWEPGNQPEILFGLMNDYDKEFLSAYGYQKFGDFVNPPIELAPYGEAWQINYDPVDTEHTKFLQVQDQRLPELIMCDPAEFDAKWDAFVEEIGPSAQAFEAYMQEAVVAEAAKVLGE
jgi:putative aldouronate transport system substrate-binding protein